VISAAAQGNHFLKVIISEANKKHKLFIEKVNKKRYNQKK
jgi:hypothetical protein